jgi:surfeit locus 1 family protein
MAPTDGGAPPDVLNQGGDWEAKPGPTRFPPMTDSLRGPSRAPVAVTRAGLVGTILLLLVVAGCVRLGFWQLSRHEQRQQRNEQVAARLDMAPVPAAALLGDTAGIFYRAASVAGTYDSERSIVLPGRSYRGVPGVHLLTPLRLADYGAAVLVNRGWVPSADAATIDVADFAVHSDVFVTGLVMPFPGADQSLAQRTGSAATDAGFRRVWYSVDESALRAQFPYPLLPVMLQALPERGAPAASRGSYPASLEPPPLDDGPHLGYALQWFSFALIGVIGWVALILRGRMPARTVVPPPAPTAMRLLLPALLLPLSGTAVSGQLRPLDPVEWRAFDQHVWLVADAGVGMLHNQRASLAGTTGALLEGGNYAVTLRAARLAVSFSGTAVLRLTDEVTFAEPIGAAHPADGRTRHSAGRAIASTLMQVTPDAWPVDILLRFGTVLPTTSHRSGLDRDRTDFFALAALRYVAGPLTLTTEHGVGINGTVLNHYPQSDVWAYGAGAFVQVPKSPVPVRIAAELVGQQDGHGWQIRGNEDLQEVRVGFDAGNSWLLRARYVRGRTASSPSSGWRVGAGIILGRRR